MNSKINCFFSCKNVNIVKINNVPMGYVNKLCYQFSKLFNNDVFSNNFNGALDIEYNYENEESFKYCIIYLHFLSELTKEIDNLDKYSLTDAISYLKKMLGDLGDSFVLNESIDFKVNEMILFIYNPYTWVIVNYSQTDQHQNRNESNITLIGFNRDSFMKFCTLIGHNGFMANLGFLFYDNTGDEQNEEENENEDEDDFLPSAPRPLTRQNAIFNGRVNYDNDAELSVSLSRINPLGYSRDEINKIVRKFYTWDRIRFFIMASEKIDANNMLRLIPTDIIRKIARFI